jgi:probable rRNA maturation factor
MNRKSNIIFLEVSNKTSYNIEKDFFWEIFQSLKKKSLLLHKISSITINNSTVSLVIINDAEIKSINKKYRDKDKVTDVLSFEFLNKNEFVLPENKSYLGEIFISYPEAIRKSKEFNISIKEELALLFIHGLLHLLGYDHVRGEDEKVMKKIEKKFLKETNVFFKSN